MMSTAGVESVDATLQRITSAKGVQGVIILQATTGIVIRFGGVLFERRPASPEPLSDGGPSTEHEAEPERTLLERYATAATALVDATRESVQDIETGDDVRFMRIRTKRHELMITPDPSFVLVVITDPTLQEAQ
ncbi:uncharacterized protein L969DRAFT_94578 [Mixia osmundae IAM 14324]|uniref:Roadblock/LAMTOR2 domain-containing protein n=1 Tax=Mixia osmundae (strain CBS 9802 / IAM 14324 / JCM 22182 / KY 12970) TaxID=764103 RepID=G7DVM5_MIXOS|nr:uncharacterized protein L969DRAFT_94578 [Mixia osmundae IAM 14324]KEI39521.1 hypothetical protein L969DRAFT_94578 [Mixia osmundae IAM 14324]GAA94635.1 hypothetical protein E5Q_01287 [Mixia osmundae IAM 14324]